MIDNARVNSLPLSLTFIDLRNAFGSVSHDYIQDILEYVQLPKEVQEYISAFYGKLSAYIATKDWKTPRFSIERGVFQGDTLSPLIFLLAFNPIIEAINSVEPGFQLMLPSQSCNEASLPGINTYIYARWDEEGSDEPPGWYLAKILSIDSMGLAVLKYRKGNLTEEVNLSSIKWIVAINGRGKWFLPLKNDQQETSDRQQLLSSSPHGVKGFADDLTVISPNKEQHKITLAVLVRKCKDLGLQIRADKCVSMVFNGHSMVDSTFDVGDGVTKNIREQPTKFLGCVVASSPKASKTHAGKLLLEDFSKKLQNLNRNKIRGEYKLWIYKRYLTQTFRFFLSVNTIPATYYF